MRNFILLTLSLGLLLVLNEASAMAQGSDSQATAGTTAAPVNTGNLSEALTALQTQAQQAGNQAILSTLNSLQQQGTQLTDAAVRDALNTISQQAVASGNAALQRAANNLQQQAVQAGTSAIQQALGSTLSQAVTGTLGQVGGTLLQGTVGQVGSTLLGSPIGGALGGAGRGIIAGATTGVTGGIAPQTCDSAVWETMRVRAEMQTQREVMMNQNLIFKSDSVLAYTCFDKMAGHAAKHGGNLFTHTQYFGSLILNWGAPYGMDQAMQNVVVNSMSQYLQQNFAHSQLGGRGNILGGGSGPLNAYVAQPINAGGGDYNCDVMNAVWRAAKCANFIHNNQLENTDGFYPFVDLMPGPGGGNTVAGYSSIGDIRKFPNNMACNSVTLPLGGSWNTSNDYSLVRSNIPYAFHQSVANAFREVDQRLTDRTCSPTVIRTGIQVIQAGQNATPYPDGVCTNPGCIYDKDSGCVRS